MRRRADGQQREAAPVAPLSGALRRTMKGRVYVQVDKRDARQGDVVDYVDGGWRTRRVAARRGASVTVDSVRFQRIVVDRRRRVALEAVEACWRLRASA